MPTPTAQEQNKLESLVEHYRGAGYRVVIPRKPEDLPEFLDGYLPDLIAEKGDDKVILEVKETSTVRGSNELELLAKRVEDAGWRFELVTFQSSELEPVPSQRRLNALLNRAKKVYEAGLSDAAYIFVAAVVESFLRDLADQHGIDHRLLSIAGLARRLTADGIVSRDVLSAAQETSQLRNRLAHSQREISLTQEDIERLSKLARQLRGELQERAAAA